MKFAKEFENELVPEWRVKYLDYKLGKKKVKAVARALRNLNEIPNTGSRWRTALESTPGAHLPYTHYDFTAGSPDSSTRNPPKTVIHDASPPVQSAASRTGRRDSSTVIMNTPPLPKPESRPLQSASGGHTEHNRKPRDYGSMTQSPTPRPRLPEQDMASLDLPDPAISPAEIGTPPSKKRNDAYHVGPDKRPPRNRLSLPIHPFRPHQIANSSPGSPAKKSWMRSRLPGAVTGTLSNDDVPLQTYHDLDQKQGNFFGFLDRELAKIEAFHSFKEEEASERLQLLRAQLHEMRDRRIEEISKTHQNGEMKRNGTERPNLAPQETGLDLDDPNHGASSRKSFEVVVSRRHNIGETTKAMTQLGTPSEPAPADDPEARRDYVRHVDHSQRVPYRTAKRKLKVALQEFYRGLELLKSYALVNRTAFRKINKKYDKAVNARPTGQYMTEKVNKARFVNSEAVESYIVAVEDLYSRYFERGNRKIAIGKLRSHISRPVDLSTTTFRNGIWLAAGAALGIQGTAYGFQLLLNVDDPLLQQHTGFLLQLYGGYFLGVLLFLGFTLDCFIWTQSRINYAFVFEFDSRNVLDWRERAELPSFFFLLNGLFIWLNFRRGGQDVMFLYWPAVLVTLTLVLICLPARILYHRGRRWWAYTNWRILLAGLYPVQFRDFFLGDMYCSLTYLMGNIEVFFCLYAQGWSNPSLCNSNHSRLQGFFTTLPAIWRFLQCLRRYYSSRKWFPHLANCGKYTTVILCYMSLSLYRIDKDVSLRILFIFFAAINALYCSIWDIAMDWSLGNPYAPHPFLRNTLGYRRVWPYYLAMLLDPILRFSWILYVIFDGETQRSSLVSFFIALAEVTRRSIWAVFRVENEHCSNVGRTRASRNIPLPYTINLSPRASEESGRPPQGRPGSTASIEVADMASSSSIRRRRTKSSDDETPIQRGIHRVGTIINQAHTQDFERKKRASVVGDDPAAGSVSDEIDSSDNNDDDEDDDKHNDPYSNDDVETAEDMQQAQEIIDRAHLAT